jgi:hypothetical protein
MDRFQKFLRVLQRRKLKNVVVLKEIADNPAPLNTTEYNLVLKTILKLKEIDMTILIFHVQLCLLLIRLKPENVKLALDHLAIHTPEKGII